MKLKTNGLVSGVLNSKYSKLAAKNSIDKNLEQKIACRVESILIKTFLYLQSEPEQLELTGINNERKPSASALPFSENYLSPIIIGKNYKPKTKSVAGGRAHASPQPHFRRGHYRRVPIGPKEKGRREWRWIEPVFVNGSLATV